MNEEQQAEEIIESKIFLEKKLGIEVCSLAFPVGGLEHINQTTLELTERAGYDVAFYFNTGVTRLGGSSRYAIPRVGTPSDFESFKAPINFPHLMDYNAAKRRKQKKARL